MSLVREVNYDEVRHAQSHFRKVLDSMARPGKVNELESVDIYRPQVISRSALYVSLALMNGDVSFWESQSDEALAAFLSVNAGCSASDVESADFLLLKGVEKPDLLERVKEGLLTYPDLGATLILDVVAVSEQPLDEAMSLEIGGPGVKGSKRIWIRGLDAAWISALLEKNAEFPLGVDTVLAFDGADGVARVCCLPRSALFKTI